MLGLQSNHNYSLLITNYFFAARARMIPMTVDFAKRILSSNGR